MRLLITGATGFIGSEVFCRLSRKLPPDDIVLLGRRRPDLAKGLFCERLAEHGLQPKKLRSVETDFMDGARFRKDLASLDSRNEPWTVVHLAALIHGKGDRAVQERINIGVTRDLLDWVNARGGHFVFSSSVVAFGGTREPVLRSEKDFAEFPAVSEGFDYFSTKRAAHLAVLEHARVPVTILCPGVVHGSLENYKDSRGHLKALREGRLKLAPSGGGNIVALDSVADAIVQAALDADPKERTTRLLVDRNLTYAEYFTLYVSIARGLRAQKIRRIPPWIGKCARGLFKLLSKFGVYSQLLDGLAQGSLYLHFRSEHAQPHGEPIEKAIRASLKNA